MSKRENSKNPRTSKKKQKQEEPATWIFGSDLTKLIASFLDYYDQLNMSFVCRLFQVAKPEKAIIGNKLIPKENQRVYEIGKEIIQKEQEAMLFEVHLFDVILNQTTTARTEYKFVKHLRIYWNSAKWNMVTVGQATTQFPSLLSLEIIELDKRTQTASFSVPRSCKKLEKIIIHRWLLEEGFKYAYVYLSLSKNIKEIAIYVLNGGKSQIDCRNCGIDPDPESGKNFKIEKIHGYSHIGLSRFSDSGRYISSRKFYSEENKFAWKKS